MVRPDEGRQLDAGPAVGRAQQEDLGTRAGYADDGVEELVLQERAALDLETKRNEERRRRLDVGHRDADVVQPLNPRHAGILQASCSHVTPQPPRSHSAAVSRAWAGHDVGCAIFGVRPVASTQEVR